MSNVSDNEYNTILSELISRSYLKKQGDAFIPNESIEPYFLPMKQCFCVAVYRRIQNDNAEYSVSFYPSSGGISAVFDDQSDTVRFINVESTNELITLLSPFSDDVLVTSYVVWYKDATTIHIAQHKNNSEIYITEAKKTKSSSDIHQEMTVSAREYRELLLKVEIS